MKDGEMFESGKSINVPARSKFLNIEIIPDKKEYKPRDPATYTVFAHNADGTPAAESSSAWASSTRPFTASDPTRRATSAARFAGRVTTASRHFSTAYNFTGYSGSKRMISPRTNARTNWPISKARTSSSSRRFARISKTRRSGNLTW